MAEKRDLRPYANSEDPDQTAHQCSLVSIFAVRLHNKGGHVEDIGLVVKVLNRRVAVQTGLGQLWGFAIRVCPKGLFASRWPI